MSMIDDASDQTKDAIKEARHRAEELGDSPEDVEDSKAESGEDPDDTSGEVPVANLE